MKIWINIFVILLLGINGLPQNSLNEYPGQFKSAISILHQSKASLPADSLLFQNELQRVRAEYKAFADSLKSYGTATEYAAFENQRLINLCYAAAGLQEFKKEQNKLFEHLAAFHTQMPNPDSINQEIAKCLVNSYESHSIWFEDSLLHHVTTAMKQHLECLQSWSWLPSKKQAFVDMYAAQYYKRGIISMAEPVFRDFRDVYSLRAEKEIEIPNLSENYPVLSAKLQPTNKTLSSFDSEKIVIVATVESPFNLIYLITQLRTAAEAYPDVPVLILRNPAAVNDNYVQALKRNLAISGYYIVDLTKADSNTADDLPCCYFQAENDDLKYATNSPIDFLEWLERPLKSQMKAKNQQLHENYRRLQQQKDSLAAMPEDTTTRFRSSLGMVNISFQGYWNQKPDVKIKQYNFTESNYADLSEKKQLVSLEFFIDNNPIYSLDFIPTGEKIEIDLIAGPRHKIKAKFSNTSNKNYYESSKSLDSLMFVKKIYDNLVENYPFSQCKFMEEVQARSQKAQTQIVGIIDTAGTIPKALLSVKYDVSRLITSQADTSIQNEDFKEAFSFEAFDSVIWKSPYYSAWVDAWLNYGKLDLKNAIDLLYGSWKTMPNSANTLVGDYLWNKMNSMGRFDVMVHLDTTWLAGCSDIKDLDVMKRVEGYKRMAPGKKAPNIYWEEDGVKMDLYSIKADTIIVVFWSDQCSHCEEKLPGMYKNLSPRKDISVIAVAVDSDASSISIGNKHMSDWHHVWADEGWKDDIIELFNIFGTPEMYVLDENHKIISKQLNYP